MIRVQQVKVPLAHTEADIVKKACKMLRQKETEVLEYRIVKQSVDAEKAGNRFRMCIRSIFGF